MPDANPAPRRIPGRSPRRGLAPGAAVGEPPGVGLFRRRITEDTDLEGISDKRLLQEHRRRVLAASDSHGGVAVGATFGLASDIEDVLDRRGVSYPSAEEILGARPDGS